MTTEIRAPKMDELADLGALWRVAFGDADEDVLRFFDTAFSPDRARCLYCEGELAAMLYWFDTEANGTKIAYLYAIATAPKFRRRGFCSSLLRDTHAHLFSLGYGGAALVPACPALFDFYSTLGYRTLCEIREGHCLASSDEATVLRRLSVSEYARLRRSYLPRGGLIQEGACLLYLASFAELYEGDGLLVALSKNNDTVRIHELLGSDSAAAVAYALASESAFFRAPGAGKPFAMYLAFDDTPAPTYLGLALD